MTQKPWAPEPRRRRLVAFLLAALACACQSPSAPQVATGSGTPTAPASPTSPAPPPSSPSATRFHVTGVVTDENGLPLPGARVEVGYNRPAGDVFSDPPSFCPTPLGCWFVVKTDAVGRYDVVFDAGPSTRIGQTGSAGNITALGGGWHDYQILPWGQSEIVQNLRVKRLRSIGIGGGTTVTISPDSSLCTDLEDLFALSYRCETVEVSVGAVGTVVVEARAESGGVVPTMFWATSGNYDGFPERSGPGTLTMRVRPGQVTILVGLPAGSFASERFNVSARWR